MWKTIVELAKSLFNFGRTLQQNKSDIKELQERFANSQPQYNCACGRSNICAKQKLLSERTFACNWKTNC